MAQSLQTLRNSILTTLLGRRVGLTPDEYLVGQHDVKLEVTDLTSASTGTAIPAYGIVNISGTSLLTSGQLFLLSNPVPGVDVTIINVRSNATAGTTGCTSMAIVRPSTAFYIASTEQSSGTSMILCEGAVVTLTGVSTALYSVKSRNSLASVVITAAT